MTDNEKQLDEKKEEKGFWQKAADAGKKAASGLKKGAEILSDKTKDLAYQSRLKKYNPLFPDEYTSESFKCPNMIVIVDDAVRRGIDVCEGAIGWLDNKTAGMEILFLYDEAIEMSGLIFYPSADCDAVYYVDRFDRKRFIRVDNIFSNAHEERLAELEHIAFSLGAKSCTIEILEEEFEFESFSKKQSASSGANVKGVKISSSEKGESQMESAKRKSKSGKNTSYFDGHDDPKVPELKWFANNMGMKRLIEMRFGAERTIKSKMLELEGTSFATISQKTASAIDSAVDKIGVKSAAASSMERQAMKEIHSKLVYELEF